MRRFAAQGRRLRAASWCLAVASATTLAGCESRAPAGQDLDTPASSPALVDACGGPATAIAALPRTAGTGIAEMGRMTVEGVVVASFVDGLGAIVLQSAEGDDDGNPATPEGLFVEYTGQPAVKRGQRLRVSGKWSRSDDRAAATWALRDLDNVLDCGEAAAVPPPIELIDPPADWSSLSGMRVRVPGPVTVTGNESLLRFGELTVAFGGERLYAATELARPGPQARRAEQDNRQRSLLVDDARAGEYPQRLWQLPQAVSAKTPYRAGSQLQGLEGVIDHRHGRWRLQLTRAIASAEQAARPAAPARDEAALRVASFNVLNFFNGDGSGGGFPTERGAASRELQQRQRAKLVSAMQALDADVIGLMEIENDGYAEGSAIAELAAALAPARRGAAPVWQAIQPDAAEVLGSDVISVGLVYRSDRVSPVGPAFTLDSGPFDSDSRMPLAQAFKPLAEGGRPFLVVVNHFKSKGGCPDADAANADQGDGQACYNAVRRDSATRLGEWLAGDPAGIGAGAVLILGDLNAYRQEDPIRALERLGYRDLLTGTADADAGRPPHSYVFQSQAGLLDHALAGQDLAERVIQAGVWAINADEVPEFAYDGDSRSGHRLYAADPWRSSDHDPVWVDLRP